jgi:hypothetical protein
LSHLEFHPSGIFYPYVGSFLVAMASLPAFIDPSKPTGWKLEDRIALTGIQTASREIHPYEIHRQLVEGEYSYETYGTNLCIMLTNTAFEAARPYDDKSPVFEFFRHVRNASSHRNEFNFSANEPAKPAAWRGISFDTSLKGSKNPFFGSACFGYYMGFVDILELLWDVEQLILPRLRPVGVTFRAR